MHRVERLLETIEARAAESAESRHAARQHLEQVAQGYTMQRQRDVHQAVIGRSVVETKPSRQPAVMERKPAPAGDFGENVELF